jgi:hypothetical protein
MELYIVGLAGAFVVYHMHIYIRAHSLACWILVYIFYT